jgi:glycosyltransferase involved in cell wall biosynthesis
LGRQDGGYALFVGRLSPEKGLRTLLDAWRRLKNTIPLRIVGDGPLRPELVDYAARNSLSTVSFLGRLTHSETQEAIKCAHFLIVPSECYENFPMTIVESFASGTPVVCSRLGGMQEIVKHRHTGLHFDSNSSDHLAESSAWAWAHQSRMREMGMAARREYEMKYTAEKNHSLLMDIYHRTLQKPAVLPQECDLQRDSDHAVHS